MIRERLPTTSRRLRDVGREVLLAILDHVDTRYADALNPREEYPRINVTNVESPVATEAELEAGDVA